MHDMFGRRDLTRLLAGGATLATGVGLVARSPLAQGAPVSGGVLTAVISPEPTLLTTALTTALVTTVVAPKIFDGLFVYDWDFKPQPALATAMEVAPDGKTVTIKLREGVRWHDGRPFSSADVAFTVTEVWKKLHPRLRALMANVTEVETPDALTVVMRLSKPSPAMLIDLMGYEAGVLPKHLYEGTDIPSNPHNLRPVGTGPFKFVEWRRGEAIILEKNADYWDAGKPYLDRIVFRVIPDGAGRSAALERGEVLLGPYNPVPLNDVARLRALPTMEVESKGYEHANDTQWLEFNLSNEYLKNVKVRQAISRALDRSFIARNIWFGLAEPAVSPVPRNARAFFTDDVPSQAFSIAAANTLLDEAGYPRAAGNMRFKLTISWGNYSDGNQRFAEYLRQTLRRIGIDADIRNTDYATWLREIWTERAFDMNIFYASATADPTIGLQRFWYSGAYQRGVPFTNASGYNNPAMDQILMDAAVEPDPARRRAMFVEFQKLAMTDLPILPIVELTTVTIANRRVRNHTSGPEGIRSSFADTWLAPS
ncbi:ABC transporter substrate-binding protein [Humitalea sp. 24SJ18S-53]|uniref:ABC transporter substrate-binding protein n=1 Tax=Humitalea sp. 24SJ18S-53 TaxID=3422307 RepID=UPI003D66CE29